MANRSILLSDRVGTDLAEAIVNLELLKKSLEIQEKSLQAEKANLAVERQQWEDEKAKLQIKVSQLESGKSKLETRVSQLESDKKQREAEIQGLNDKVKQFERQLNGKMTKMIPARELGIEWGGTPQYWTWKVVPDSMYEVAELIKVTWLAISCRISIPDLTPNTTYGIYLVFKLTSNHTGFYSRPSKASVGIDGGESTTRNVFLVAQGQGYHPTKRQDGWMEVELGHYYVRGFDEGYLSVWLSETEEREWKSGLVVQGIEVRAK